jgi:hypothetical protein
MKNRQNPAKENFLRNLPDILIENRLDIFRDNIAFSFQYFDNSQAAGQDFSDWTKDQIVKLLNKLKHYSSNTMAHWRRERIGGGRSVLEVYGNFPVQSEFTHPKHVPLDIEWARFRLEGDMRLIGFILPNQIATENSLVKNIFYIVFLDQNHRFYLL